MPVRRQDWSPRSRNASASLQGEASVVERLRRELNESGLDCLCRDRADALLARAGADETRRTRAAGLDDARKMRDAIVIVTSLLGELDEVSADEPDTSVFAEIAGLFDDLEGFAAHGAAAARLAARAAGPHR